MFNRILFITECTLFTVYKFYVFKKKKKEKKSKTSNTHYSTTFLSILHNNLGYNHYRSVCYSKLSYLLIWNILSSRLRLYLMGYCHQLEFFFCEYILLVIISGLIKLQNPYQCRTYF